MRRALAATLLLLGGCAGQPQTAADARACAPRVTFAGTEPLDFSNDDVQPFDVEDLPCALIGGRAAAYLLLALPPQPQAYALEIESLLDGDTLMPPRVELIDAGGAVVRSYAASDFTRRAREFSTTLFLHPGEPQRFLLVTADAAALGGRDSQLVESGGAVSTGYGAIYLGKESRRTFDYTDSAGVLRLRARMLREAPPVEQR